MKRFGISVDDTNDGNDDDNADVNVAVNDHQKRQIIVCRKIKNIGGIL